jgi:DNA end-binding protein Ku
MPAVETVSRVRQHVVAEADEAPVERSQLVKGYEFQKDQYVVLEKEELQALTPETDRNMQISEFVKLDEIDPVYFENSYYVAPEKAGIKPYSLLYEALRQSGFVAIAEFAMHRRNHVVVLRPGASGILLHSMFYTSEIRSEDEFSADKSLVSDREIEMGKMLITAMAAPFEPEKFRDTYKEQLEALIQAKIEGRSVAQIDKPKPAPASDIMKALQSSLEIARKPVASAGSTKSGASSRKKRG